MIGLDTNVLVRYVVQDEPAQARAATRLIETKCSAETPGFVSLVVLTELVWVLDRAYGYPRADISAVLGALFATAELRMESPQLARMTAQAYAAGPADFADYLIGHIHSANGCETTYTFDRRCAKSGVHALIG